MRPNAQSCNNRDRGRFAQAFALAVGVALCLGVEPAWAWQQYKTSQGKPMRWPTAALAAQVTYAVDETGLQGDGVALPHVRSAVAAGLQAWQSVACGRCQILPLHNRFADAGTTAPKSIGLGCAATSIGGCDRYGPDGNHVVLVHEAANWPYGNGVIAMTVLSARTETGAIVDADVALNDAAFAFCTDACTADRVQLEAVFRHEAGHLLGLDHSAAAGAVMHAKPPDIIAKPTPMTADDKAGLCAVYVEEVTAVGCAQLPTQAAATPAATPTAAEAGCATRRHATGGSWPGLVALLALGCMRSWAATRTPREA